MSVETTFMLEGDVVAKVPPALDPNNEGKAYGLSFAYGSDVLNRISQELGHRSIYDYYLNIDKIADELEAEIGDPQTIEEEDRFNELLRQRYPWFSASDALPQFQAILEHVEQNEDQVRGTIESEFKGSFDGVVWDLRVLVEVLKEATAGSLGFRIDVDQ